MYITGTWKISTACKKSVFKFILNELFKFKVFLKNIQRVEFKNHSFLFQFHAAKIDLIEKGKEIKLSIKE